MTNPIIGQAEHVLAPTDDHATSSRRGLVRGALSAGDILRISGSYQL